MQSAGAQELHSAHWGLAEVLMCGIPWKELMGMGVDMETSTSYGRGTTAETLYLQTPQCCFSAVQWDGCLPWPCFWGLFSDSSHGVLSWAFPQPSKIKHDNLFP